MARFTIIVAATPTNGIGKNGVVPWHIHKDLEYFRHVTQKVAAGMQNVVIMGRKTWDSIPATYRPLAKRFNIVISSNKNYKLNVKPGTAMVVGSLSEALEAQAKCLPPIYRTFIIGGASLYGKTIAENLIDKVLMTRVTAPEYDCDTFMLEFRDKGSWKREPHSALVEWAGIGQAIPEGVQHQDDIEYEFQMWTRADLQAGENKKN